MNCYICNKERGVLEGKLWNGNVVSYCGDCWKSLQEGLKIWREKNDH